MSKRVIATLDGEYSVDAEFLEPPFVWGFWNEWEHAEMALIKVKEDLGHCPSSSELRELGYGSLVSSISKKHGGHESVREYFGEAPTGIKPKGYWQNEQNIEREVEGAMEAHSLEVIPDKKNFERMGLSSISYAITTYYPGGFRGIRGKFKEDRIMRPNGHWDNLENVESEIAALEKRLGHFPTQKEMAEVSGLSMAVSTRYGGIAKFNEKVGRSSDTKPRGYWRDWGNVGPEVARIMGENQGDLPDYVWMRNNEPNVLRAIERHHGGVTKIRRKLGKKVKKREKGFWKDRNELIIQINDFMDEHELVELPTATNFLGLDASHLHRGIMKNGGYRVFRKLFEEEQKQVAPGTWQSLDYCLDYARNLKKRLDINRFPSVKGLREIKETMIGTAISRYHGGMNIFRGLLGEDGIRTKMGAWKSLEYAIAAGEKIIGDHGWDELPSQGILDKEGYCSFAAAVGKYHGGILSFRGVLRNHMGVESKEDKLRNMLEEYVNGGGE